MKDVKHLGLCKERELQQKNQFDFFIVGFLVAVTVVLMASGLIRAPF